MRVEDYARQASSATAEAIRSASRAKTESRTHRLQENAHAAAERDFAAALKDHVIDHLGHYLREFEAAAVQNGIQVHWAQDAESARQQIARLIPENARIVKGKSMATEEIHLNAHLEAMGCEVVETDLGEFVVQLDGDTPSHIVTPIIHKTRHDVSASFARAGLGETTTDPPTLAAQAREHLREKFRTADVGISGANFLIAETGRIVIVENEGNNRLSTTAPRVHIAVVGIEKLLPRESDLAVFLRLLAPSATGQRSTVYTHLITGPRQPDEFDGPEEVHIVLLDNGRSEIAKGPFKSILRCIRCGACLNVCPVFRELGGHGYGHVYSGPVGAVLAPLLDGSKDLPFASSLCGACEEVCPVRIPIPDLLLKHRSEQPASPLWKGFGKAAGSSATWKAGLTLLPMAPTLGPWTEERRPPAREGRPFRSWWAKR